MNAAPTTVGFRALARREVVRVTKLWTQTIIAPVVSSALFILVFGLSLGDRIKEVDGFPYDEFIVPGLVAMTMAQAAYNNNSASLFQARFDRYLHDVLSAPIHHWQVNVGLNMGGVVRALLIGVALTVIAVLLTGVTIAQPLVLLVSVTLLLVLFCNLGVVVGIYAQTCDHTSFINNLVILPLSFLGGVFYSVDSLPSPWQELSHVNPLFFLISGVRHGFLGESDVPLGLSLGVTAVLAVACAAWSSYLFRTGKRLKP
jgi:ABC-2 type transport system permease protein